jgi:nitrite reductase/ring-hydroxylating ferredoxin subunit
VKPNASLLTLCPTAAVPEGAALQVETGSYVLAVFNLGGKFFVIDDACTHGPGSLSEGCIDGDVVECDFHNGAFNIVTGEVVAPPCMVPVRTYRVEIVDGNVCIDPGRTAGV